MTKSDLMVYFEKVGYRSLLVCRVQDKAGNLRHSAVTGETQQSPLQSQAVLSCIVAKSILFLIKMKIEFSCLNRSHRMSGMTSCAVFAAVYIIVVKP